MAGVKVKVCTFGKNCLADLRSYACNLKEYNEKYPDDKTRQKIIHVNKVISRIKKEVKGLEKGQQIIYRDPSVVGYRITELFNQISR